MSASPDIAIENVKKDVRVHQDEAGHDVKSFYINGAIYSKQTYDARGNVIDDITYDENGAFFSHTHTRYVPDTSCIDYKNIYDKEKRLIETIDHHYDDDAPFLLKKKEHRDSLGNKVKTVSYQYKQFGGKFLRVEKNERTHDALTVSKYAYVASKKATAIIEETKMSLDKKVMKHQTVYDAMTGRALKTVQFKRGKKEESVERVGDCKWKKHYRSDGRVGQDLLFMLNGDTDDSRCLRQKRTFSKDGSLNEIKDYYVENGVYKAKQTVFPKDGNVQFFNLTYSDKGIDSIARIQPNKTSGLPLIGRSFLQSASTSQQPEIFYTQDNKVDMCTFWSDGSKIHNYYMYEGDALSSVEQRDESGVILKVKPNHGALKDVLPIREITVYDPVAGAETSCAGLTFGSNAKTLLQMLGSTDVRAVGPSELAIKQNIQAYKATLQL